MNEVWMVIGMFLVTYITRYLPIGMANAIKIPNVLEKALGYVLPSVLMAIIIPTVLITENQSINLSFENSHLLGALGALLIGLWKDNLILTIVSGMAIFFLTHVLFGLD